MIYVGRDLPTIRSGWSNGIEPALIQPHLPVNGANPDRTGSEVDYWPSFEDLSARARAGYLEWLADGRRRPDAYIGFVFLFFYGIERRLLVDGRRQTHARSEADGLLREIEGLLAVYGEDHSFRRYAGSLLEVGRLLDRSVSVSELEPPSDATIRSWDVPLTTKIALGAFAQQGEVIPSKWALSWVLSSQAFRLRTPARRCSDEFRRLFELRYPGHFAGRGLRIRPNKTRLSATYYPASSSFAHGTTELQVPDLPDVTVLTAPVRKLQALVDKVTDELDAYSRWVGRKDDRESLAALALLPAELAMQRSSPEADKLFQTVEEAFGPDDAGALDAAQLVRLWPSKKADKLSKAESTLLSSFLQHKRIGLEPDCRYGGPPLGKATTVIVFRLDAASSELAGDGGLSQAYGSLALILRLAAAVAAADGEIAPDEQSHLAEQVESSPDLTSAERLRLRHHLRWLFGEPPGLAGLKRRIEVLDSRQRNRLGRFVLAVAAADGRIDAAEIKTLRKIYPLLGLSPDDVFSDVHSLMSGQSPAQDPVTVVPRRDRAGHPIPKPNRASSDTGPAFLLDAEKIRSTRKSSDRIAGVLAEIFQEETDAPERRTRPDSSNGPSLCGLDSAHSMFLSRLASRTTWERVDIERLADELGLLPDGALELVNEAAIEVAGDPLLEGVEVIEIDTHVLQEMTS